MIGGISHMVGRIWRAAIQAAPVRVWAIILGAPPLTLFASWLTRIVWKGPWPIAAAPQQLQILGWALWGVLGLLAVIVVALAAVKVRATGVGGTAVEIGGGGDAPPTSTTET